MRKGLRGFLRIGLILAVPILLVLLLYVGNVVLGMHVASAVTGTIGGMGVGAPVEILRDARGVPHIRARNEHDLFYAQGYVEASDRLFQLDLIRRFVYGQLAEVLGPSLLDTDENARTVPVASIVAKQWARLSSHDQAMLQAFADGVNAGIRREPTPVEFRVLMYRPKPWQAQDSLAIGFATVLDLIDSWNDIADRTGSFETAGPQWAKAFDSIYPLTDPCYEAPVTAGLAHVVPLSPTCLLKTGPVMLLDRRPPIGSNEWAAGSAHTATGRALLANDPHLRLSIPGVWYLVDLQAPGYHAAGATLAGTPGVILGHNDHVAWGATNGTVSSLSVYDAPHDLDMRNWQTETFHVRLGHDTVKRYYRSPRFFGATVRNKRFVLVDWSAYRDPQSPLVTFGGLDRARSIDDALRALRAYTGPTQNFEVADTSGRVAYTLAGSIPNDPAWARYVHPASDAPHEYPAIPFDQLPHVNASREAIVWTANNKMYGAGYPYRLSPQFAPPYRAYRIAELLRARSRYDVAYFKGMQMDTLSLPEHELAQLLVRMEQEHRYRTNDPQRKDAIAILENWDGRMRPDSVAATIIARYRLMLTNYDNAAMPYLLRNARMSLVQFSFLNNEHEDLSAFLRAAPEALQRPWSSAGSVTVKHSLAALGLGFLNGTTFAGDGDAFTVHVQNTGFSQSFRAVWDVGNWDAGGITIPQGESGEPGSPHYTDEAADWTAGSLLALPFTQPAVDKAARDRLTLTP